MKISPSPLLPRQVVTRTLLTWPKNNIRMYTDDLKFVFISIWNLLNNIINISSRIDDLIKCKELKNVSLPGERRWSVKFKFRTSAYFLCGCDCVLYSTLHWGLTLASKPIIKRSKTILLLVLHIYPFKKDRKFTFYRTEKKPYVTWTHYAPRVFPFGIVYRQYSMRLHPVDLSHSVHITTKEKKARKLWSVSPGPYFEIAKHGNTWG